MGLLGFPRLSYKFHMLHLSNGPISPLEAGHGYVGRHSQKIGFMRTPLVCLERCSMLACLPACLATQLKHFTARHPDSSTRFHGLEGSLQASHWKLRSQHDRNAVSLSGPCPRNISTNLPRAPGRNSLKSKPNLRSDGVTLLATHLAIERLS